jgi:xanthine dehydrogenase/oxidase
MIAHVLGLPEHKVVCKAKRLGGGFGGKETRAIFMNCAAAVPAYDLQKPVRLCLDRDEDMQMTGHRHAFYGTYKVGFNDEGKILAVDVTLYNNAGNTLDLSAPVMQRAVLHADNCYNYPNTRFHGRICKTNISSNTAFRGFGGPQGMIITEAWMDHVASELKMDVEKVRAVNLYQEGDKIPCGMKLDGNNIVRIWEELMVSSRFEQKKQEVEDFNQKNKYRKRGIAMIPTKFGIAFTLLFFNQGGALVHIYTDGTVLVTHGGVEMGQGLHTKIAQIAAQTLKIPVKDVFISETSTDKVPNASPTAASASSDMYGAAVLDACNQLNERLQQYREMLPGDASLKEIATKAHQDRADLSAHGFYKMPDVTGFGGDRPFLYFTYGAACAEVEVDVLTGDFQILKTDILMDVGNSINPAIDVGQIEGGFMQGLGLMTIEEAVWGDKDHPWVKPGVLHTRGPGTYKIPTANDIPIELNVALLQDAPNPHAVASSKAIGEPPLFLACSVFFAIKNALYSARKGEGEDKFFNLYSPATPEKIRMACIDKIINSIAGFDYQAKTSV